MAITDTATDTSTETTPATAPGATGFALPAPAGIVGLLGSGDHKTLGRFWIAASGMFGIGSTALLAWFLAEAATDAASQTDRAGLNFTLAIIGLVLGFVVPLFIGLATVVVPLQVGASTIAFPRAAAAALWSWLLSAALVDFAAFRSWKNFHDAYAYDWPTAAWRWLQGAVVGAVTSSGLSAIS